MAGPRSGCHLISFLVLLSTCFSFTSAAQFNGWGSPGATNTYCYACGGNFAGIVIGLPTIAMPGLAIGLPSIGIGPFGIQIGYFPGYGYAPYGICCVPGGGGYIGQRRLFTAPTDPHSGQPGFNPGVENEMLKQESKGHNEDKHTVKPKMEARKHGSQGHQGDEHIVNTNKYGSESRGEYKKAYNMAPTSSFGSIAIPGNPRGR